MENAGGKGKANSQYEGGPTTPQRKTSHWLPKDNNFKSLQAARCRPVPSTPYYLQARPISNIANLLHTRVLSKPIPLFPHFNGGGRTQALSPSRLFPTPCAPN